MNKLDLQKIIREEVKKSLNETYRDPKENVAILHAMMKKGGKDAKRAKEIVKDIKDELSVIMSTTDPKANLKLVNKVPELDEYLDDAIEMALDDGMGRARGMMGSMQGMREATATKDDLDKIGDFVMSLPQFERFNPSQMKSAIKDMHSEWKKVAAHYKNIEAYFEEMEEMGGLEAFMESKKPSKSKKTLKEGYAWERGERKFGQPLPTLASVQKAYQAKQSVSEIAAIPTGTGRMTALKFNREYSILDAGTGEFSDGWEYLGEVAMGSSAGEAGDYMFRADDAPGAYVFVALSEEDLKTMVKPI
jgi:hypothetical protein